jgi:uncharacterized protein
MREENIAIGQGTSYPLDGVLVLPDGEGKKFPAVVLVHGSGAHDRDETIFAVKPFKDIATSLVGAGVAVLRYDKRSFIYGKQMMQDPGGLTVGTEVIDDAIAAANLLKADPRIDADKVFILGHSLGAMLAPRIDVEGGDFAGLVLMGGSPRTLWQIIYDQNQVGLATLSGEQREQGEKAFAAFAALMDSLPTMPDEVAKKTMAANIPAYYLKEMDLRPASEYLKDIDKPMLIMQGAHDISVSVEKDFGEYKRLLGGRSNVTFRFYPELNHLFMPSKYGTIEDYNVPGHVDEAVLADIASWILSNDS